MRADEKRLLLEHASRLFGGAAELAEKLGIGQRRAELYLSGDEPLSDALFRRLVEVLGEDPQATVIGPIARKLISSS
jgi:plasmid maintenance system antidote protein VapI